VHTSAPRWLPLYCLIERQSALAYGDRRFYKTEFLYRQVIFCNSEFVSRMGITKPAHGSGDIVLVFWLGSPIILPSWSGMTEAIASSVYRLALSDDAIDLRQ
jgi:hypothetical protein